MPIYDLRHRETGEEKEVIMSVSEMQEMTDPETGEWSTIIGAPAIVSHQGSIIGKTSGDYRDLLKKIHKGAGSASTINA